MINNTTLLGAIVAHRLHHNGLAGDFFVGIYATRVANYLEIPIHENDTELLPAYLDHNAMLSHHFIERNEQFLQYRLIFDRRRVVHVTLLLLPFLIIRQNKDMLSPGRKQTSMRGGRKHPAARLQLRRQ